MKTKTYIRNYNIARILFVIGLLITVVALTGCEVPPSLKFAEPVKDIEFETPTACVVKQEREINNNVYFDEDEYKYTISIKYNATTEQYIVTYYNETAYEVEKYNIETRAYNIGPMAGYVCVEEAINE